MDTDDESKAIITPLMDVGFFTAVASKTDCPALRSSVIDMTGNNSQMRQASARRAVMRRRFSVKDRTRAPQRSSKVAATTSHAILSASSTLHFGCLLARKHTRELLEKPIYFAPFVLTWYGNPDSRCTRVV